MIRRNLKLLLTIFIIVTMSFSFFSTVVKATDIEVTSEPTENINIDEGSKESTTTEEPEIHRGDLYLFDTKVVMDKLVDGNVFIIGQEVEITGQINGNLFVCANKLTFNNCYVINSIFACANSVYYNGACNDLYVVSKDIEMTYASFIKRDLKSLSSLIKFKTAVGRDADLLFNNIVLEEKVVLEEEKEAESNIPTIVEDGVTYMLHKPIVYGNLRYSAPSEVSIPEDVITENGSITYTDMKSQNVSITSFLEILNNFLVCIVTTIAICIIIKTFTPKFATKLENKKLQVVKLVKCFAIGLASIVAVIILFILLLITQIGIKLGFILTLLFIVLCLLSAPIFAIIITNNLKPVLKLDKKPIFYLVLCLVSIVLYGVTLIPFVGGIFSFLIMPTSIGLLINMAIPHKELTDEEKPLIEDKKKQAKEKKEKRQQEKTEAKEAKEQAKLEAKNAKKENKDE